MRGIVEILEVAMATILISFTMLKILERPPLILEQYPNYYKYYSLLSSLRGFFSYYLTSGNLNEIQDIISNFFDVSTSYSIYVPFTVLSNYNESKTCVSYFIFNFSSANPNGSIVRQGSKLLPTYVLCNLKQKVFEVNLSLPGCFEIETTIDTPYPNKIRVYLHNIPMKFYYNGTSLVVCSNVPFFDNITVIYPTSESPIEDIEMIEILPNVTASYREIYEGSSNLCTVLFSSKINPGENNFIFEININRNINYRQYELSRNCSLQVIFPKVNFFFNRTKNLEEFFEIPIVVPFDYGIAQIFFRISAS